MIDPDMGNTSDEEIVDTETQLEEEDIAIAESQLEAKIASVEAQLGEEIVAEDQEMNDAELSDDEAILSEDETTQAKADEPVEDVAGEETKEKDSVLIKDSSNKAFIDRSKHQIYIGNIDYDTKGEDVKAYFETFGELSVFTIPLPNKKRKSKKEKDDVEGKVKTHRGFAFIGYVDESIAKTVLEMEEHKVDDRELKLSVSKKQTSRIFVGGLDKNETKIETVRAYFEQFGEIMDINHLDEKGYCFVTMVDNGTNIKKILEKAKHEIDGKLRDVGRGKKNSAGRMGSGSNSRKKKGSKRKRGGRGRGRGRGRGDMAHMGARGGWGMQAQWGMQAPPGAYTLRNGRAYGGWGAYGKAALAQQYHPYAHAARGYAPQGYAPHGYAPHGYAPHGYAPSLPHY